MLWLGHAMMINQWIYEYPLVAIENGHLYWIFPWKMVIFHSYVSLPEGTEYLIFR